MKKPTRSGAAAKSAHLLDTSTLLWALGAPERLSARVRRRIESGENVVSVASYWEIVIKTQKGRRAPDRWRQRRRCASCRARRTADHDSLANHMGSLHQAHVAPPTTPGAPGPSLLGDLWQDLRYTARMLRAQGGFTAAALLMLAVGIGATTTIFSVVNSVLIKPLPYPDSDALVRIVHSVGGTDQAYFNDAIFVAYTENTQTFADIGVWSPATTATVTGRGDPDEVRTLTASRGVLTTLGVQPRIGRVFSVADDMPGAPDVVILTNGYWLRKFGGVRDVLGEALTINARPHQIIGVMPAEFRFDGEHDVILPRRIDRGRLIPFFRLLGVARLRPGVTLAQANADAARILRIRRTRSLARDCRRGGRRL